MELHRDVEKLRSSSATSSASSVAEYVNEVFTESEVGIVRPVSIQVTDDTQWIKNPLNDFIQDDPRSLDNVTEFNDNKFKHSDSESGFLTGIKNVRKMYLAATVVLLFAVSLGITVTYSATATKDMQGPHSSVHPTDDEISWIGSLMAVGALVGGSAGGYFTNALGRKGALILDTLPFVIGWCFITYAKSTALIYIGRIITGFCCGIVSVATPMYLVEISSPEVRGLLGSSFQLFVVIGVLLVSILGSVLTWRYLAVAGAGFSLLAGALMVPMPESPAWLMSQKRRGEAKNAILFLQGEDHDADTECSQMEAELNSQPKGGVSPREMGVPGVYKPFLLSIMLMFFQQFSGVNAILFYTVQIFEAAHSTLESSTATIIVATVQVFATLVASLLMDRAGRKPLLLFSGVFMALSLITFGGFEFARSRDPSVVNTFGWLPLVCLMGFIAAFSIGFGPAPWLMVAEMTPSRFRSIVAGIATALNWTFAFIVTKTFTFETVVLKSYGVYWMYSSFCVISIFATLFLLPETKGKTEEEIQEFFTKRKDSAKH